MVKYQGEYAEELETAIAAARVAGDAVRLMYEHSSAETYIKVDGSPVTDADLAADRIVRARIAEGFPGDAILTEEVADDAGRLGNPRCWIVDPIDGTQQFIDRTGEFDVVIALAVDGEPVVGVLHQPPTDQTLIAVKGGGAWIRRGDESTPFRFNDALSEPIRIYTSVYFGAPESLPELTRLCEGLGSPAPGVSHWGVTPREFLPTGRYDALIGMFVPTRATIAWEWDFAAPDLFMREAGGCFTALDGTRFTYNKPDPRNVGGLLMARNPRTHAQVLTALAMCRALS